MPERTSVKVRRGLAGGRRVATLDLAGNQQPVQNVTHRDYRLFKPVLHVIHIVANQWFEA